jgi:hypothetical protein
MVSRALRIVGLLLLVCGTSAAQSYDGLDRPRQSQPRQSQPRQSQPRQALRQIPASALQAAAASRLRAAPSPSQRSRLVHAPQRDAAGRTWSAVDLGSRHTRSADGTAWTTERIGSWSYSSASDGTRCVSRRSAQTVFISCH